VSSDRLGDTIEFDDYAWPKCQDGDERSFRVMSAFARAIEMAGLQFEADVALVDVGPNLGPLNRAALLACDFVVVPLARLWPKFEWVSDRSRRKTRAASFLYGHGQAETARKIAVVSAYPANALSPALSKLAKVEIRCRPVIPSRIEEYGSCIA
jgi:hypothetical protein